MAFPAVNRRNSHLRKAGKVGKYRNQHLRRSGKGRIHYCIRPGFLLNYQAYLQGQSSPFLQLRTMPACGQSAPVQLSTSGLISRLPEGVISRRRISAWRAIEITSKRWFSSTVPWISPRRALISASCVASSGSELKFDISIVACQITINIGEIIMHVLNITVNSLQAGPGGRNF